MSTQFPNGDTWSLDADGNGDAKAVSEPLPIQISVYGTFGGGTVKIQSSPDFGTTWVDVPNATLSADGFLQLSHTMGELIRPVLSGSTSPDLTIIMDGVIR